MSDSRLIARIAALVSGAASAVRIHRAALLALHHHRYGAAEALFERAAIAYRRELAVEPLARLRVQQLIARVRAHPEADHEGELTLEIERRLCRLDRIESLEPPFELVESRELLASWMSDPGPDSRGLAAA